MHKPGWQTTEFWLGLAVVLVTGLMAINLSTLFAEGTAGARVFDPSGAWPQLLAVVNSSLTFAIYYLGRRRVKALQGELPDGDVETDVDAAIRAATRPGRKLVGLALFALLTPMLSGCYAGLADAVKQQGQMVNECMRARRGYEGYVRYEPPTTGPNGRTTMGLLITGACDGLDEAALRELGLRRVESEER